LVRSPARLKKGFPRALSIHKVTLLIHENFATNLNH
jgi:hypothetical protein